MMVEPVLFVKKIGTAGAVPGVKRGGKGENECSTAGRGGGWGSELVLEGELRLRAEGRDKQSGHEGGSGTIGDGEREGDKCKDNNTGSEVHPHEGGQ
jgi:hypothetical protein